MMKLFAPIGWVLGWVMYAINSVVHNYGITLIIFAVLVKVCMIPLGVKQQKGLIANARITPKMKELQKAYGNNKQRYSEELQKLYDKEGFSPLSSCLPMVIQFPILFGMLDVIYYPIKHMLRFPAETIDKAISIAGTVLGDAAMKGYSPEYPVFTAVRTNAQPFIEGIGAAATNQIANFDFTMFGLFMGEKPSLLPDGKPIGLYLVLLLIPILSGLTSLVMSLSTMKSTNASTGGQMAGMNNSMLVLMPLMSVWISFIVPAGVGIYWLITNILSSIQTIVLNRTMNPAAAIAKAEAEDAELRERERLERIEAKKRAREQTGTDGALNEKALSQKELNRRKLAEARRRDAERYGEEYVDVSDDEV
ncbi:MAG: YidC/Oxa1 family membrane protein insertase [Oscillospiraceae bacterium]